VIIRVYRATVQPDAHAKYEKLIREKAIPLMRGEEGLVELRVGTPRPKTPDGYVGATDPGESAPIPSEEILNLSEKIWMPAGIVPTLGYACSREPA
jgi:hypothetical protein